MDEAKEAKEAAVAGGVGEAGGAPSDAERALVVRRGPNGRAQKGKARSDGWTASKRRRFMTALAETCNVTEAARMARKSVSSAYSRKRADPGFAREWQQALTVGYDELETLLLREALFGSEQEEVTLDADGAVKGRKLRRGRDSGVAFRLMQAHREEVLRIRAEQVRDGQGGADALERLRAELDAVRARRKG